jgi:general secretion pathway protein K
VAATVFADQRRWGRTVEHRRDQVQAQAVAGINGVKILYVDARRLSDRPPGRTWAVALPPIPLDNGTRSADRSSMRRQAQRQRARHHQRGRRQRAVTRLPRPARRSVGSDRCDCDWIDSDKIARGGAEDALCRRPRGGLTPNAPVQRVAELFEVKGVAPASLSAVAPFLTALPPDTPVNVNTAPPEVLAAIVDKLTGDGLAQLVTSRAQKPFSTLAEFRARLPAPASVAADARSPSERLFLRDDSSAPGSTVTRARALLHRRRQWPGWCGRSSVAARVATGARAPRARVTRRKSRRARGAAASRDTLSP